MAGKDTSTPEPDGPADCVALVVLLETRYEALTPSWKKLANRLLTNPERLRISDDD
jgi:hypothetical protein